MIDDVDSLEKKEDLNETGITVYLKLNYKVVLLIAVAFDLVHVSLDEFILRLFRF